MEKTDMGCTVEEIASCADIQYWSNDQTRTLLIDLKRFQSNTFDQTLLIKRFRSNALNQTL